MFTHNIHLVLAINISDAVCRVGVTRAKSVNGSNQANQMMLNVTARIAILKNTLDSPAGTKATPGVCLYMLHIYCPPLSLSAT